MSLKSDPQRRLDYLVKQGASCRTLWLAVIEAALREANGIFAAGVQKEERSRVRSEAWNWFHDKRHGFRIACNLAGLDPDAVSERAEKMLSGKTIYKMPDGKTRRVTKIKLYPRMPCRKA